MRSDEDTRKTAIHEAGHAVVGHLLGSPVEFISIVPDTERGTDGHSINLRDDPASTPFGDNWNRAASAIAFYAGHMATIRMGYDEDFEAAGAYGDYCKAEAEILDISGGNPNDELKNRLLDAANLIVEMTWGNIELIAEHLEEQQTIDGKDIPELLGHDERPYSDAF